jgi:plastocyanin
VRISLVSGLAAGFVLVVASACGGNAATTPAPTTATGPSTAPTAAASAAGAVTCAQNLATGQQVGIAGNAFVPGTLTVASGSTVSWTNADPVNHTVTFDAGPDCGQVSSGQSVTAQFPAPGTYAYHCKIHSSMHGTVTVS